MDPNSIDEIDCASFFDQIDDLLEFPLENEREDVNFGGNLVNSDDIFATKNSASDLSSELYVPYEEIAQLGWLSPSVEDSFAVDRKNEIPCPNKKDPKDGHFETSSPIESSSSSLTVSSTAKPTISAIRGTHRARSKRARPPSQPIEPTAVHFEGFEQKKKKKKKSKAAASLQGGEVARGDGSTARKCLHCEVTKTPQWRAGPMGPKTLCNACGVRFKSGRLFPEYRPAGSPTFVPAVHSNSHKKVLEMRNKAGRCG